MAEDPAWEPEPEPEPDRGEWPAWLDEDDFDGLGEDAWRAAMESLAEEGPSPDEELFAPPDDRDPAAPAPAPAPAPVATSIPTLGFGPHEAGESMPPGVSLAMLTEHAVAGGSLPAMSDYEMISLIAAARRQRNRAQWLELQVIREFARRRWESDQAPARDADGRWRFKNSAAEHAADELAFELTDSRGQSEDEMDLSLALRDRLPRLNQLLAAGRLDDRRAQAVRDVTIGLTDAQARQVDEMLAPDAPDLPCTALRRRAAKLAISLNPEAEATRKRRATRRKARVEKFPERSGNYALAVREMPVEEILASEAHIRALAAHLRSHGVAASQREAEVMVYLDLTQGRDPLDRIPPGHRDPETPSDPPGGHPAPGGDQAPGDGQGRPDDEGWRDGPWDDYDEDADNGDEDEDGGNGGEGDGGGRNGGGNGGGPRPFAPPGPARPGGRAPFPAAINLLVPAGTAFGWSAMPGEAAREIVDPVTLREMMQAASRHPATRWCVTLVAQDGTAVAHGCARGRHHWDPPPGATRTTTPAPGQEPSSARAAALAEFLARLKPGFEPIARDACDHRHAEPRYRPGRKLRHLILARNATCPAPGCQASSQHSDLDHTRPWPDGTTDECNLGPPCRHHHRTKQAPGWQLEQPAPGTFRWTTPSGHAYETRPTRYDI